VRFPFLRARIGGAVLKDRWLPDHVATGTCRGQGSVVLLISETAMRLNAPSPFRMGCTMDAWIPDCSFCCTTDILKIRHQLYQETYIKYRPNEDSNSDP